MKKTILATALIATGMVFNTVSADNHTQSNQVDTVSVSESKVLTLDYFLEQAREQSSEEIVKAIEKNKEFYDDRELFYSEFHSYLKDAREGYTSLSGIWANIKIKLYELKFNSVVEKENTDLIPGFVNASFIEFSENELQEIKNMKVSEQLYLTYLLSEKMTNEFSDFMIDNKVKHIVFTEAEDIIKQSSYSEATKQELLDELEEEKNIVREEIKAKIEKFQDENSFDELKEAVEEFMTQ